MVDLVLDEDVAVGDGDDAADGGAADAGGAEASMTQRARQPRANSRCDPRQDDHHCCGTAKNSWLGHSAVGCRPVQRRKAGSGLREVHRRQSPWRDCGPVRDQLPEAERSFLGWVPLRAVAD